MEKYIIDEKTGISYTLQGDYYIPDLTLPPEKEYPPLGKYGRMRLTYLKENKKAQYSIMLMDSTLNSHLHDIDEQANIILEQTIKAFAEANGCDEKLKVADQMKWVGLMNNYRHCAEEIIFKELIYI
ncbi:MAG: TnpV protein [Clostridia bacterium]|nr:TnpV protein [Clostridia bacterium]